MASARCGNYLVYFPSYEYLQQVLERFRARFPNFQTETQTTGMSEAAVRVGVHRGLKALAAMIREEP